MAPVNPIRGEAKVKIGEGEYTLAVTMESLAQLSDTIGDPPFHELFRKLMGGSIFTQRAALSLFVQSGIDAGGKALDKRAASTAAVRDFTLADLAALNDGMAAILTVLSRKPGDEDSDPNRAAPPG